jgi:Holliday junction resolvase RusA-like endonuclease
VIEIRMDGQPIGKGRPRFSRKFGTAYTPEKTARYEDRLAWTAQSVMGGRALLSGSLSVTVNAHMEIPKSKSKRWRSEALGGMQRPTTKPDADNVAKLLDSLNKIVWVDDAQIVALHVFKHYADRPRLEILVTVLDELTAL